MRSGQWGCTALFKPLPCLFSEERATSTDLIECSCAGNPDCTPRITGRSIVQDLQSGAVQAHPFARSLMLWSLVFHALQALGKKPIPSTKPHSCDNGPRKAQPRAESALRIVSGHLTRYRQELSTLLSTIPRKGFPLGRILLFMH